MTATTELKDPVTVSITLPANDCLERLNNAYTAEELQRHLETNSYDVLMEGLLMNGLRKYEHPFSDSVCRKACEDISKQRHQLAKAKSVLDLMSVSTETGFDNFDEVAGVAADIVGKVNNRLDEIETILSREARS